MNDEKQRAFPRDAPNFHQRQASPYGLLLRPHAREIVVLPGLREEPAFDLCGVWYVAYKVDGGVTMRIFTTKRLALKAARELVSDNPNVEVGPMLDSAKACLPGMSFAGL